MIDAQCTKCEKGLTEEEYANCNFCGPNGNPDLHGRYCTHCFIDIIINRYRKQLFKNYKIAIGELMKKGCRLSNSVLKDYGVFEAFQKTLDNYKKL